MEFDYIYRTNLSSFIDFNKAYDYLKKNYFEYAGCSVGYDEHRQVCFGAGCGFILSKKATRTLVNNQHFLEYGSRPDDVAIGYVLREIYDIHQITRPDIVELDNPIFTEENSNFHFRCKSDLAHTKTVAILEKLLIKIYKLLPLHNPLINLEKSTKNTGRLTTVISSVNNNPNYYMFIPKQIFFWGTFGIRFIAIFAGEKIPPELMDYKDNIILWNRNTDLNSIYLGQNLRMYYASLLKLPDDEVVMITDMDMLPTNISYYATGIENISKEVFICYRFILEHSKILMCYNAAHPDTWAKIFDVYSEFSIERQLTENYNKEYTGVHGSIGWYTDEQVLYKKLEKYPHVAILNKHINRLHSDEYYDRLSRGDTHFIHEYDDAHFHTDYFINKDLILDAEKQLKNIFKEYHGLENLKNIKNIVSFDTVSVIIPTYNRFNYLLNAIKSVQQQTYTRIEIIVVNDCSTDPRYYSHDFGKDVTVIHLKENTKQTIGFACAGHVRNEGIKVATGKYIAFLDDDDIWFPNKLELQLRKMEETKCKMSCTEGILGEGPYNKDCGYPKYNSEYWFECLKQIYQSKNSKALNNGFPDVWSLYFMKIHNCVICSSVVVEKSILEKINNMNILKNGMEDYDCWLRIATHTNCCYVKDVCFYYDNGHADGRNY
jgi:GT2 family glycosyltransferase